MRIKNFVSLLIWGSTLIGSPAVLAKITETPPPTEKVEVKKLAHWCRQNLEKIGILSEKKDPREALKAAFLKKYEVMNVADVLDTLLFPEDGTPVLDRLKILLFKMATEQPIGADQFGITKDEGDQLYRLAALEKMKEWRNENLLDKDGIHSSYGLQRHQLKMSDYLERLQKELSQRRREHHSDPLAATYNPEVKNRRERVWHFTKVTIAATLIELPIIYYGWLGFDYLRGVSSHETPSHLVDPTPVPLERRFKPEVLNLSSPKTDLERASPSAVENDEKSVAAPARRTFERNSNIRP